MAHYLAVEVTPGSYEAVNVKKTTKGKTMFPNDERYECTLEEIDKFTTKYDNLFALTYMLYSEHKISWANSALSIVYVNGIELKISQDVLFASSKKYLENPALAVEYITNKFQNFDTEFIMKLNLNISETSMKTIPEDLMVAIETCITHNAPLEGINAMHIAQKLIYDEEKDASITINYEKLHNIVAFIANYENSRNMQITKTKTKTKNT